MDARPLPDRGAAAGSTRREKRKVRKRIKRKQCRRRLAEEERLREEARLNDPEEQRRMREEMEILARREEIEKKIHEEEERRWLERERRAQEEFRRKEQERLSKMESKQNEPKERNKEEEEEEEEDGEYEDGPSEIIWEGNEITIKKTRVKVGTKSAKPDVNLKENENRPTRNPSPPPRAILPQRQQSHNGSDQVVNFGTEQDKTYCPFHIKTGACRFGTRCNRLHVYPEKSCTLLIKNMYTGPGLAWEHDEGLEFTDEEVEEQFQEFYDDVHSEFLKFGELVNFKVCRNSSPHLRGNVYAHYQSEDAAVSACLALSGRFYASRQMLPEFVGVTKWKVALCGEYMKPHQTCSRGSSCNFLHCFRNPGGEYEWADRDGPPPRPWRQKMASLFGNRIEEPGSRSDDRKHRDREHGSDHRRSRKGRFHRDDDDDRNRNRDRNRDRESYGERRHRKRDEREERHGLDRERKRSCRNRSRVSVSVSAEPDDDGGRWLD